MKGKQPPYIKKLTLTATETTTINSKTLAKDMKPTKAPNTVIEPPTTDSSADH